MINFVKETILPEMVNEILSNQNLKNTLFLDGSWKGYYQNCKRGIYSFDHHEEGRFTRTCATYQVACAIIQGLDTKAMDIVVNHTDADSVLATMFAMHPDWISAEVMIQLEKLNRLDNHGPACAIAGEPTQGYHFLLSPRYDKSEDSADVFMSRLEMAMKKFQDGTLWEETPERKLPGVAICFSTNGEILKRIEGNVSFGDAYKVSGLGMIFGEKGYVTIGKKPFFQCKSLQALWKKFNETEAGWGGADTIGGSPREGGTKMSEQEVTDIVCQWLKDNQ
jgi:hypothetical protein